MNEHDQKAIQAFFNAVALPQQPNRSYYAVQMRAEYGFYRAVSGGDIALVTRMIDAHPDAVKWQAEQWRDRSEDTSALHLAAERGNVEMAALLLSRGAKVDALDFGHATPLTYAAAKGHFDMVQLLLAHGAKPDQRSYLGHVGTPASLAGQNGHDAVCALIEAYLNRKPASPKPFGRNG